VKHLGAGSSTLELYPEKGYNGALAGFL